MNATTLATRNRNRKLRLARAGRLGVLAALATGFVIGTLLVPPHAQSAVLQEVADAGRILGIVNLWDVLANPLRARQVCHGLRG